MKILALSRIAVVYLSFVLFFFFFPRNLVLDRGSERSNDDVSMVPGRTRGDLCTNLLYVMGYLLWGYFGEVWEYIVVQAQRGYGYRVGNTKFCGPTMSIWLT